MVGLAPDLPPLLQVLVAAVQSRVLPLPPCIRLPTLLFPLQSSGGHQVKEAWGWWGWWGWGSSSGAHIRAALSPRSELHGRRWGGVRSMVTETDGPRAGFIEAGRASAPAESCYGLKCSARTAH